MCRKHTFTVTVGRKNPQIVSHGKKDGLRHLSCLRASIMIHLGKSIEQVTFNSPAIPKLPAEVPSGGYLQCITTVALFQKLESLSHAETWRFACSTVPRPVSYDEQREVKMHTSWISSTKLWTWCGSLKSAPCSQDIKGLRFKSLAYSLASSCHSLLANKTK